MEPAEDGFQYGDADGIAGKGAYLLLCQSCSAHPVVVLVLVAHKAHVLSGSQHAEAPVIEDCLPGRCRDGLCPPAYAPPPCLGIGEGQVDGVVFFNLRVPLLRGFLYCPPAVRELGEDVPFRFGQRVVLEPYVLVDVMLKGQGVACLFREGKGRIIKDGYGIEPVPVLGALIIRRRQDGVIAVIAIGIHGLDVVVKMLFMPVEEAGDVLPDDHPGSCCKFRLPVPGIGVKDLQGPLVKYAPTGIDIVASLIREILTGGPVDEDVRLHVPEADVLGRIPAVEHGVIGHDRPRQDLHIVQGLELVAKVLQVPGASGAGPSAGARPFPCASKNPSLFLPSSFLLCAFFV